MNGDSQLLEDGANLAPFLLGLKRNREGQYWRIIKTLQLAAPYIVDLKVEPSDLSPQRAMLRWQEKSGAIFGPHQLSDGTLRLIALLAATLQPAETMPSLMLFDEPEVSLHPHAVEMAANLLKGASLHSQVFVATQSPQLISQFVPSDVLVCERHLNGDDRGGTKLSRLDPEEMSGWIKEYSLGDLYTKNVNGGAPLS